jgi:hypothetical protein
MKDLKFFAACGGRSAHLLNTFLSTNHFSKFSGAWRRAAPPAGCASGAGGASGACQAAPPTQGLHTFITLGFVQVYYISFGFEPKFATST